MRTVLVQKSSRRVEEIKAKGALAKVQPENQNSSAARKSSKPEESQPLTCKAKVKSGPKLKTLKPNTGPAEQRQTTEKPGFTKQKKPQPPLPGILILSHFTESKMNLNTTSTAMGGKGEIIQTCTPEPFVRLFWTLKKISLFVLGYTEFSNTCFSCQMTPSGP